MNKHKNEKSGLSIGPRMHCDNGIVTGGNDLLMRWVLSRE